MKLSTSELPKHKWAVYYDDGSVFDWTMGTPEEAPPEGVIICIGYEKEGTRYSQEGWNFYQWDKDALMWMGMDVYGLHDRLRRNLVHAYKEGRTVTGPRYLEILRAAVRDPKYQKENINDGS